MWGACRALGGGRVETGVGGSRGNTEERRNVRAWVCSAVVTRRLQRDFGIDDAYVYRFKALLAPDKAWKLMVY
jgi:hypothetical protein